MRILRSVILFLLTVKVPSGPTFANDFGRQLQDEFCLPLWPPRTKQRLSVAQGSAYYSLLSSICILHLLYWPAIFLSTFPLYLKLWRFNLFWWAPLSSHRGFSTTWRVHGSKKALTRSGSVRATGQFSACCKAGLMACPILTLPKLPHGIITRRLNKELWMTKIFG